MTQINIVVSVDWEGRDLDPESLAVMESFRNRYPRIPMQHFLNAAYYTKPGADSGALTGSTQRVLLPVDCLGLHIHPWKSLCEAAGVTPRSQPNFREAGGYPRVHQDDWGHEISLDAFTVNELRALIQTSLGVLGEAGLLLQRQFRSGAWLSGPTVTSALILEGFKLDASALNRRFIQERWGESPLFGRVSELWRDIDDVSQPYLQTTEDGSILQAPNNGCLADYTSPQDIFEVFQSLVAFGESQQVQELILSIGFHQETAKLYLGRLEEGLEKIITYGAEKGIPVGFVNSALPN